MPRHDAIGLFGLSLFVLCVHCIVKLPGGLYPYPTSLYHLFLSSLSYSLAPPIQHDCYFLRLETSSHIQQPVDHTQHLLWSSISHNRPGYCISSAIIPTQFVC